MTARTRKITLAVVALLTLSACSAGAGAGAGAGGVGVGDAETPSATGGAIELAVAETCTNDSDPKCISVRGEYIVLPSAFERAGVEDAMVAEDQGPNVVDVTFTEDGATVLRTVTTEAAQAGDSVRLVMKIGGEIRSAVTVMEALDSGRVQIDLSPNLGAQEAIGLIQQG